MMNGKNMKQNGLEFEINKVSSATAQIIRNVEQFYASALILVNPDGFLDYVNSRAIELFELDAEIREKKIQFRDLLYFLAQRGDFGAGEPESFVALTMTSLMSAEDSHDKISKSYLTMPSSNILRILTCRNSDGSLTLSAQDVSDQRRNENMLEMALDIGFAGYIVFDTVKKTRRLESRYMTNILTQEELHSLETNSLFPLFHPDDLERAQEMWSVVRQTGETERATLRIMTQKEGVRWLRFVLMPESESPQCTRIVSFFNDVTDTLRHQESLRQAKSLAEESLSSKEDFLARMSHEIRTPMNAVIGMTDALIHHHSDAVITPKLELIQKSATSILRLLDETLTHSRLGTDNFSLDPMPASPAEVVKDVCALWEQQALKNNGVIRCTIKSDVPDSIIFDKFRYEQCVNNLLSNAVKFTDGGKIDVILTVVEKSNTAPYLVLAVRDTGIGMTKEQQAHIFEAYTQADKSISSRFGGTGLGMNITKQIVDLMGGTISVRSELGVGSMFAISVPLILNEMSAKAEIGTATLEKSVQGETDYAPPVQDESNDAANIIVAEETAPVAMPNASETDMSSAGLVDAMLLTTEPEVTPYSNLRILVVDDNPTNHLVVQSLLGSIVLDITVANNGLEALEALDKMPIDIVLMDIHMPVMDGIECTLSIRSSKQAWKDVTIIALTADPQYQQIQLCKNIGMDEALAKPVRLNDLLEAIDLVLPTIKDSKTEDSRMKSRDAA